MVPVRSTFSVRCVISLMNKGRIIYCCWRKLALHKSLQEGIQTFVSYFVPLVLFIFRERCYVRGPDKYAARGPVK